MKHLYALLFVVVFHTANAQNLVVNPGFEQVVQCPSYVGQVNAGYLSGWTSPTLATPDFMHVCGTHPWIQVPVNYAGYQQPQSGSGYGTMMVAYSPDNHIEYLQGTVSPLSVNIPYRVTIHVNLTANSQYATSDLAVFFFQNGIGVNTNNTFYLPLTPQVNYSAYGFVADTQNWVALVDTFVADSSYTHFIVGNFHNWANTNKLLVNSSVSGRIVYHLDSVSVEPIVVQPLIASFSQGNVSCYNGNNGSATANPYGGLPPYTYQWSNGQTTQTATGLTAGTYTCTITDALNSTTSITVTITQPSTLLVATVTNTTPATCGQQNGSATVSVTGGVPGYLYQWLPYGGSNATATGLGGGTYTCTVVDAGGCTDTAVAVITQTSAFTLSTTVVNPHCNGGTGSATVTPAGGTAPFSYLWSNNQTTQTAINLAAGTYTVTVTDANGCTATASVTLVQPPPLTVITNNIQTINCYGYSTAVISCGPFGGTGPYSYLWSSGHTTQTVNGLPAGTYWVTVTDAQGCTYTATINVAQPPQLTITTTSTTNATCGQNNGSATVSASGGTPLYGYSWQPYGGTGTTASNLGTGIYTVTVTDANNCTATTQAVIGTATPLSVSVTSSSNVSCHGGNNGTASVNATGGTQPYLYNWSNGGTTASISNLVAGIYTVVVTDANGCSGTATVTITQPPVLNATVSSITPVACNGQSNGSASVLVTGGSPGYGYQWAPAGGTNATATGLASGNYTCTVTDTKGCIDTVQVTITQPPALSVSINSANATCSQNNGWATAIPTGGTTPYTYQWSNGQTTTTANNLGAGTYTLTVTDALNCMATATVSITQSAALTLNIAASDISCHGLSDGSATVTVSTGTLPYTYNWSNGGTTQTISNLTAGSYTINITDAIGCAGTATVSISEPAILNSSITGSTDVLCNGAATGNAVVGATGGTTPYSYLWSNGQTTTTASNLTAGTYAVTVTDSNGCNSVNTVTINEPSAISLTTQVLTGSCVNQMQGAANATVSGGTPPYAYSWNSTPQQNTANATGLAPGNYTLTITDDNSCTATATITITGYPLPGVYAGNDTIICGGKDSVYLQAMGADSYVWSPATWLSCTNCANPLATPVVSTTYTLTGTDANGCTNTDMVTVGVQEKHSTAVGADKDICIGESTQLFAEGGFEYSWSPAANMSGQNGATPVVSPEVTTTYTVVVRQSECYTDTLTQTVTVFTPPSVNLGPDRRAIAGSTIILQADTLNATSLLWTPPINLSCYDCTNPEALVEKDIRYVVTVSNGPCIAVDDVYINVSCSEGDVFCANTFTPNGDGVNDHFYPQSSGRIMVAQMAIYDRWGEELFERSNFFTNEPGDGWDGTYKGRECVPESYSYFVQFLCGNGQKILVKGDINLVK